MSRIHCVFGYPDHDIPGIRLRPARRKLIRRGKKMISKEGGGGNDRIAQYIPLEPDQAI